MITQRPIVGVLALTLELYESLAPSLRPTRERWLREAVLPTLAPDLDVRYEGAVFTRDAIEAAVAKLERDGADTLLVVLLTYAPSQLALPALQRTRLPFLIWNTQELAGVDAGLSMAAMIDNHGVHGTQDLANVLLRCGVDFHYLTSHWRDEAGRRELVDFCQAGATARCLQACRVGMLGHPFPGMGDFAVDTTHLAGTLGCSAIPLAVEDLVQRAARADPSTVQALVSEYYNTYAVATDVTDANLESAARVELSLRGLVADHRLDAWTYQFLALGQDERTPTLPFVAASRLMAAGVGFAGEGDVLGAAATRFLQTLQAPATFSEMFTIDFAGGSVFMSHMGEANVAMARPDRPVPLVARPTPITLTRDRQLALVVSLPPGPATLMALTQTAENRWRLIAAKVAIEDFGPLDGWCVPHFKIKPPGDVRDFLTAYARCGGPHHNVVCFGDARPRLRHAARILKFDYCEL
jgi:L-arabinose isomerase